MQNGNDDGQQVQNYNNLKCLITGTGIVIVSLSLTIKRHCLH